MARTRIAWENGKEIPYDEWFENQRKKLSIRMKCVSTDAELRAAQEELERLKNTHKLMTSPGAPEKVLAHIAAKQMYQ